jgi:peptide/nickel transport system permease protein
VSVVLQEEVQSTRAVGGDLASAPVDRRRWRINRTLLFGLSVLGLLALFVIVGHLVYDVSRYRPLSVTPNRPPAWDLPFGSDTQGRDLFAAMVAGTPLTLRIGLLAGVLGLAIGTALGFASAYYGGVVDAIVRGVVDVGLTVPGLLVLIIVAISFRAGMTPDQMALTVAALSWVWPTRTIRAQVLTMRERTYVQVARLSGMRGPEIIFFELLPNLLPYLAASLVGAVSSAILASIGLEALGLGPLDSPTIGMTIYWVIFHSALLLGMWWWFLPPVVVIILLFLGLFGLASGLDEIANPRLRRSV